jgi:hypothetical protein
MPGDKVVHPLLYGRLSMLGRFERIQLSSCGISRPACAFPNRSERRSDGLERCIHGNPRLSKFLAELCPLLV